MGIRTGGCVKFDISSFTEFSRISLIICLIVTLNVLVKHCLCYTCENQTDCGDFMICIDNRCYCDEDETSETIVKDKKSDISCSKKYVDVGGKCDNVTDICVGGSICIAGYCSCPLGFEEVKWIDFSECKLTFGSPCDVKMQQCNSQNFLHCTAEDLENPTCRCFDEQEMTFDPVKQACVAKIGNQCELDEWMDLQLKCGENAYCAEPSDPLEKHYGQCKCSPGHIAVDKSHKCEPLHGRFCTDGPKDCDGKSSHLNCINNICQCKPGSTFENSDGNVKCRLLIGTICEDTESKCVSEAQCIISQQTDWKLVCQCNEGYLVTSEGQCQLGPGTRGCSEETTTQICHKESALRCIDNMCQCLEGQIFNPLTATCEGVHGSTCDNDSPKCVEHSQCDFHSKLCTCKEQFVVNDKGLCTYGYGTPCNLDDDENCPLELGLACQGLGSCTCMGGSGTIFDNEAKKCLLRFGEPCKNFTQRCGANAFCGTENTCQCENGYIPSFEGSCMLAYGQACGTLELFHKMCHIQSGLSCINGQCSCFDKEEVYNHTSMHCEKRISVELNTKTIEQSSPIKLVNNNNNSIENATNLSKKNKPNSSDDGKSNARGFSNASNVFIDSCTVGLIFIGICIMQKIF